MKLSPSLKNALLALLFAASLCGILMGLLDMKHAATATAKSSAVLLLAMSLVCFVAFALVLDYERRLLLDKMWEMDIAEHEEQHYLRREELAQVSTRRDYARLVLQEERRQKQHGYYREEGDLEGIRQQFGV